MKPSDGSPSDFANAPTSPGPASEGLDVGIGGRYRVERRLGMGGMGEVFLAYDDVLGKRVALKRVRAELAQRPESRDELRAEVLLAQRVTHANVCRIYDLEEHRGSYLLKMEFVDGETLAERLKRGPISVRSAVVIGRAVAAGLAAAHAEGVIHRDLKPHNVMVERGTERVVLLDFGLARGKRGGARAEIAGTPEYMAPEQARGGAVDERADLYSLGAMLYHLLAGEVPFPGARQRLREDAAREQPAPSLRAARSDVPRWLAGVVGRLLDPDPAQRFPTAAAARRALSVPFVRRPVGVALLAALVLLVAAAGVALRTLARRSREWRPAIAAMPAYEEAATEPAVSPDGRWVAYGSDREQAGRYRLFVEPLDGSRGPRALTPADASSVFSSRWQSDGQALLYVDGASRKALRVGLDGGAIERVADNVSEIIPCGRRLVLHQPSSPGCPTCRRLIMLGDDGTERELRRFAPGEWYEGFRCDPAGEQMVVMHQSSITKGTTGPSDLLLVPVDGGPPRPLTSSPAEQNRSPVFSSDGRSVIFSSNRAGAKNLWELALAQGASPRQLTFGPGPDVDSDPSPDGQELVFNIDVSSQPLVVRDGEGGGRRAITTRLDELSLPSLTPDGRFAVVATRTGGVERIAVVSLVDGESRLLADGELPALTLDGQEVIYTTGGHPSQLWAIAPSGGSPRRLASLDGRVSGIAVGPDARAHLRLRRPTGIEAWSAPLDGGAAVREADAPWIQIIPAPRGGWRIAASWNGVNFDLHLIAPGAPLADPRAEVHRAWRFAWDADGGSFVWWDRETVWREVLATRAVKRLFTVGMSTGLAPSADQSAIYCTEEVSHVRRQRIVNFAERPRRR